MARKAKETTSERMANASAVYLQWANAIAARVNNGETIVEAMMKLPPATWIVENYTSALWAVSLEEQNKLLKQYSPDAMTTSVAAAAKDALAKMDALKPTIWLPPEVG